MGVTRWTLRGVEEEVVEQVRAYQAETGFALGEIVSLAIRYGLTRARQDLESKPDDELPFHIFLRRIQNRPTCRF